MSRNKYDLYESSVQSPDSDAKWVLGIHRELRGRYPERIREDFCGTFLFSCAWVRRNRRNQAIAVDLDLVPLRHGKQAHYAKLTPSQKKRLKIIQGDVTRVRAAPVEMIVVGNFSFFIFKKRSELVRYFRNALRGLREGGVFLLEMAGGPGMIRSMRERKTVREKGKAAFQYVWHQKQFDPITHDALYSIHFKFPGGKVMKDAFTYDWRLWTIPEVREALEEAGFSETHVYWETTHKGEGTGEYARSEHGDNAYSWIAYAVGVK